MRTGNILIIAIENNRGISFNGRRCSCDSAVGAKIKSIANGKSVFIQEKDSDWKSMWNYIMDNSNQPEIFFANIYSPSCMIDAFDTVYIYEWSRDYPSTEKFDLLPSDFSCENGYEFDGTSHKGIVEKKFIRSHDTVSE